MSVATEQPWLSTVQPPKPRGGKRNAKPADLMSLIEAADALGIGEARLAASIQAGTGPGRIQGATYYIRREWVEAFLAGAPGFWDADYRRELAAAMAERILSAGENLTGELMRASLGAVPAGSLLRRRGD